MITREYIQDSSVGQGGFRWASGTPLLTGGALQGENCLMSAGCDWLSTTMPTASGCELQSILSDVDPTIQHPWKGYQKHEARKTLGGFCHRHWGPYTPSKEWGSDYESWIWTGQTALSAGAFVRDVKGAIKATRLDCAFDFACEAGLAPAAVVEGWASTWRDVRGLTPGMSGEGHDDRAYTAYIGGKTSDVRVRVYRKDIESPSDYPAPTMRVEIVLKGEQCAKAFERMFLESDQACIRYCASLLERATGFVAVPSDGRIPEREPREKVMIAESIAALIDQWGPVLHAVRVLGVDLGALIDERMRHSSRMAVSRLNRRISQGREAGARLIVQQAMDILRA